MSAKKALNISDVLLKLDRNDYNFYDELNEQEIKEISPWVLMRFMSSSEDNPELYLLSVNETVNVDFPSVSKHKKLMCLLLASCGIGKRQGHKWIAPPKNTKKQSSELIETLRDLLPDKNNEEIDLIVKINDKDGLKEYLTICGIDQKRIQAIFDE